MPLSLGEGRATMTRRLTTALAFAFLLGSLAYVYLGQLNADEGWYLYASRLVYRGEAPYRDFAFSQAPLLPYVYGLPQLVPWSAMYLGRLTSVALGFGAFLLALRLLGQRGKVAEVAGAAILATFTCGLYNCAIVKTYALTALLLVGALVALVGRPSRPRPALAMAAAMAAVLTRTTALAFAVSLLVYVLASRRFDRSAKVGAAAVFALGCLAFAGLVALDPEAARWNLLDMHLAQWAGADLRERLGAVAAVRLPQLGLFLTPYLVLGAALVWLRGPGRGPALWRHTPELAYLAGLALFGLAYLGNGAWFLEYYVPLVMAGVPALLLAFPAVWRAAGEAELSRRYARHSCRAPGECPTGVSGVPEAWAPSTSRRHRPSPKHLALVMLVVAVCVCQVLWQGTRNIDLAAGAPPVERLRVTAEEVARLTRPDDRLMAFEALWVPVEARRDVLAGMTMAQFSYRDYPTSEAERLQVVNFAMILDMLQRREAAAVLLTDFDVDMIRYPRAYAAGPEVPGRRAQLQDALTRNYEIIGQTSYFGQAGTGLVVAVRREAWSP